MLLLRIKSTIVWALGVSLLLATPSRAVEINPKEEPLIQVTFPVDANAQKDGPHEEIVYILYQSGIGLSFHKRWNAHNGAEMGAMRNEYTFWLRPSMIQKVVSTARAYSSSKETPPRNQQFIIEGSAVPDKVIASWYSPQPGLSALNLIQLMDGRMRDDLLQHFSQIRPE